MTIAGTLALMIVVRWWTYRGPRAAQPVTGPLAAAVLLLAPVAAGRSLADLGLGVPTTTAIRYALTCATVVAAGYAVALVLPPVRRMLGAASAGNQPPGAGSVGEEPKDGGKPRSAWVTALVAVPLSTVVLEEVAFRGVLWGLLAHDIGPHPATAVSAALFGLWHVPPHRARPAAVAGTVLFTAAAGVVLGELRHRTGGILAPAALHWAANGFGVLAVAIATRARR